MKFFSSIVQRPLISLFVLILLVPLCVVAGKTITKSFRDDNHETQVAKPSLPGNYEGKTMRRNLLLQPEAAKVMRRLGHRFNGFTDDTSVISGTLTMEGASQPIQITRRQNEANEAVEIVTAGPAAFAWDDATGFKENGRESRLVERDMAERVVQDSVDRFVLNQLNGAAYTVVGRNVREGNTGGSDNYEGPLWTVVRVDEPASAKSSSKWRLFYINEKTGLIDKVASEQEGRSYEAVFSEWSEQNGEWFPLKTTWTRDGQPLMTLSVASTSVSAQ